MTNLINGTSSDDTLDGTSAQDVFIGSAGNDRIDGGDAGYNQIDYAGSPSDYTFTQNNDGTVTVKKPNGGTDIISNIGGFWFVDAGVWMPLSDVLATNNDDETFTGTDGDDRFIADTGNDIYEAGAGDDSVQYLGRPSDYTLTRNVEGDITVVKPDGTSDTLRDVETVEFRDLDAIELVFADDIPVVAVGNNIIIGGPEDDYIDGTDANDDISSGGGVDVINGSKGNDNIDGGGAEYDQVDYDGAASDYTFTKNDDGSVTVVKPDGGIDTLKNIDGFWFKGSQEWKPLSEVLSDTDGGNTGGPIEGTDGDDYLSGTDGDDTINAGEGVDVINGSEGNDVINGGDAGYNQIDYDGARSEYIFTDNGDGTFSVTKPDGGMDTISDIGGFWFKGECKWYSIEDVCSPEPEPEEVCAEIEGSSMIWEGLTNAPKEYTVKLDEVVTEDTWVTVKIGSDTAQQTDGTGYKDFNVYYGPNVKNGQPFNPGTIKGEDVIYYTTNQTQQKNVEKVWLNDKIYRTGNTDGDGNARDNIVGVDNLIHDFLVYDSDGEIVSGDTVKVLVKAGEKTSEAFSIQANKEVEVGAKTNKGSNGDVEGNETFTLSVESVGDCLVKDNCLEVTIKDHKASVSPIVLDLNGDGEIGVTGETSSHQKDVDDEVVNTVQFDIDADGELDTIEWVDGSGDGILVDLSKVGENGSIDGSALFGDEGGKYANGYEKLKVFDKDGDGMVSGVELEGLGLWIDDGDAVLEDGEMQTAKEAGVSSISTDMKIVLDDEGRELMQSTAEVNGETILSEDVWFAESTQNQDELVNLNEEMNKEVILEDCFVG
jgi:hypothetical protein